MRTIRESESRGNETPGGIEGVGAFEQDADRFGIERFRLPEAEQAVTKHSAAAESHQFLKHRHGC